MTSKSMPWHKRCVMTYIVSNSIKNILAIWHLVTLTLYLDYDASFPSYQWSWSQKHVMMLKGFFCHDVKNTSNVCHAVKKYVMISKSLSWSKKTRHDVKKFVMASLFDVKKFVMTSQTRHDVKKIILTLNIFWHQLYISTICCPRVINDYRYVFSTNLVILTLYLFLWYFLTMSVLYQDISIYSFVTIGPHLTKLWLSLSPCLPKKHTQPRPR